MSTWHGKRALRDAQRASQTGETPDAPADELPLTGPMPVAGNASAIAVVASARASGKRIGTVQRNEARMFALELVRDPIYRENLLRAMRDRTVPAAVEIRILEYAYGKPTERVEVGKPGEFDDELEELSSEALVQRARLIVETLESSRQAHERLLALQAARSEDTP